MIAAQAIHFGLTRCGRAALVFWLAAVACLHAVEPEVLTLDFSQTEPAGPTPTWATSYEVRGGAIADGAWRVGMEAAVGFGQIDIWLNPSAKLPALAVTLGFKDVPETDLSIHLHNAAGELIAVDLFGNLAETARAGRTDTFIIPLAKFPTAARVSVRRIKGPAEIQGLVAFPVMESLDDLTVAQKEDFARLLGERLATSGSEGPLRTTGTRAQPAATSAVLGDPSYPVRAWAGSIDPSQAFSAEYAGTCYRFFTNLYLSLFPQIESTGRKLFCTSSSGVVDGVLSGRSTIGLVSYPPTEKELAAFQQKFGYPLIVAPIALDAVEVLVHPANQLSAIPFEHLRMIFANDGEPPRSWDPKSGLRGPIVCAGGWPEFGTSRFFAERVLGGAEFRPELVTLDVTSVRGVEEFVARNQNAIGFAQHQVRTMPVKVLPLSENGPAVAVDARTVNDGTYPLTRHLYLLVATDNPSSLPEPVRRFADLLLSREGQTAVADAGSFPLSAPAVRDARRQLALP
jgi:phosphate transport system substrate-binding protein